MIRNFMVFLALSLLCGVPPAAVAADAPLWEAGVRTGYSFIGTDKNFAETDLFLQRDLPLKWPVMRGLEFGSRVGGSLGALVGHTETGFLGHLGPEIYLNMAEIVQLHGGTHVGLLNQRSFVQRNFGGRFQFVNHGGLRVQVGEHFLAGYRFQHMSNADIYKENPGLNIHFIEFIYRF